MRLLHVDDNIDDLELTKFKLERHAKDWLIESVSSPQEALKRAREEHFDCILSDFEMPVLNGLELLLKLRSADVETPFVLMTGQGNEDIAANALKSGAEDYFTKDIGFAIYDRLINSIENAVKARKDKTKREQAEKALVQSESKYRKIFEKESDAIIIFEKDNRTIIDANQAASEIYGYSREELIGNKKDILVASGDKFCKNIEGQIPASNRTQVHMHKRKDGTEFPVELSRGSFVLNDKEVDFVIERDISHRYEAEQQLQANEKKYRQLIEGLDEAIYLYLVEEQKFDYMSKSFKDIFGFSTDLLLKDAEIFYDLIVPEHKKKFDKAWDNAIKNQIMQRIEYEIVADNGDRRWIIQTIHPKVDSKGKVFALEGICRDETIRKRAEKHLRQNTEQLETIIQERTKELLQTVSKLEGEIKTREVVENTLRTIQEEIILKNRIAQAFISATDEGLFDEILNIVLEKTASRFGMFGYINESGNLVCPAISDFIMKHQLDSKETPEFARENWSGIWGRALKKEETIRANSISEFPDGNAGLGRALATPILFKDDLIGLVVIADKEEDYQEDDIQLLESIVEIIAPILNLKIERDMQLRKRMVAEKEIREREKRYREVVMGTKDLVTRVDGEGNLLFVNHVSEKIFGIPPVKCIGRKAFDFVHPDDKARTIKAFNKWVQNQVEHVTFENRNINIYGEVFHMHWTISFQYNEDGSLDSINSIAKDMTETYEAEKRIIQKQQLLQNVIDSISNPIFVIDSKTRQQVICNKSAEQHSIEDKIKCNACKDKHRSKCRFDTDECPIDQVAKSRKPLVLEQNIRPETGDNTDFEIRFFPIFDNLKEVRQVVEVAVDVSGRKQAEEKEQAMIGDQMRMHAGY